MSTKLHDITEWCRHGHELKGYPYIGEVDAVISLNDVIKVEDEYYTPGVLELKENRAGVRKVQIDLDPDDKDYKGNLTCPYCGYEDGDSWELEDSDKEHECGRCGAIISFGRVVTVEYNASPVKPPQIVEANWI